MTVPSQLILELNSRCNYRCPWCYCLWHGTGGAIPRNLPLTQWRKIIAAAAEHGVKSFLFTGGEATLRRNWPDLLAWTRKRLPDGDLTLFTNGSRLGESELRFCRKHRIRLSLSLPGLRTYGAMTGTRRSYRPLLELLLRATELRWPASVSVTVNRVNYDEAPDIFSAVQVCGAKSIQLNAMMLSGRGKTMTEQALAPEQWRSLRERIARLPGNVPYCFCGETHCQCEPDAAAWRQWELESPSECPADKSFAAISPDGMYRKCPHHSAISGHWRQIFTSGGQS